MQLKMLAWLSVVRFFVALALQFELIEVHLISKRRSY